MSTKETVLSILKEIKPSVHFEGMDQIVDGAYLDSMELMALISMLMEKFNFEIDIDWISPENFNSVDAIAALVDRVKQ
ncbi:MAG: acyl carrier protein [Oscillospiraceae bacterium]|jgi:acyl carrier protein|nr:acyl carrier protein [Oscillospiraceae bacterium]